MSQSTTPTSKSVGTTAESTTNTPRTVVADAVAKTTDGTDHAGRLHDWDVFASLCECAEATIHEARP